MMGSTVDVDSDGDSDISESEMEEYIDQVYDELKNENLKVKLPSEAFVCPYCPKKKKQDFLYNEILQHASGVGNSNSEKRSVKEKAKHLALAKYLEKDLADTGSSSSATEKGSIGKQLQGCDVDKKLVWPWKGVVVNIPTKKAEDGRPAGKSGSKLRDKYIQRGFNPTRVRSLWNYWGHSGTAIVEFNKDWSGLYNALLFEKAYRADGHGKMDWSTNGAKSGLYAWLAHADDYNGNNIIGENLRKMGDVKTVSELMDEETQKQNRLVWNLTKTVEDKNRHMMEIEEKCSETSMKLNSLIEEKEKLLQGYNEELKKTQKRAMDHFHRIFSDHEKQKMLLESQKKELEIKGLELAQREAHNEIERKKLAEEIEQNAVKNGSLHLATLEQQKSDEEVRKLAEDQKMQKEQLHERIIALERQLDQKQAIELEIEQLRGQLNVMQHMGVDGDDEVVNKVETLLRDLREKEEEHEDLDKFNQALIVRERKSNEELQEARKELISAMKEIRANIGVKRMGELNNRPFHEAIRRKYSQEDVEYRTVEVCQIWEEYLKDPSWHPFKRMKVEGGEKEVQVIDGEDERLCDLKSELGEDACMAVKKALLEINEYNPSGGYITSELWNLKEDKKATLKEGVICLLEQWKKVKRQRGLA